MMSEATEKEIVALVQRGATSEAEIRIAALRVTATAARQEAAHLRDRMGALEKELATRTSLSFDGQFYWTGVGAERAGPFCPTCYDAERMLMRLHFRTVEEIDYDTGYTRPGGQIYYQCLRCSKKSRRDSAR